ncbi:proline dehydrogenase family protein [Thermicanus aegyptius]|uniref:proline dehydrogenase family protein n=1 Tax=Thermicanus aegyptius TaxID=94009 RepID=UPI00048ACD55|nr:proline dehydrogenase [Thermicanus aegyptius]
MDTAMKNFFLFLSKNRTLNRAAKKWGLRFGANRFVAGESIDEAMAKGKELNDLGLLCTFDHLGEFVKDEPEAIDAAEFNLRTLDAIHRTGVKSTLSVKLTQMGLDISRELCIANMRNILKRAKQYDNFVRIDMEDSAHCAVTIEIFKELRREFDNVGLVLQAYLYRTEQDLRDLIPYRANLRLVKGAYKEPPDIAFPDKKDVDANFKKLIALSLEQGAYTAVATHDDQILQFTKNFVKEKGIPLDRFEFQMLYGIRTQSQLQLVKEGYTVRVYVPYGNDWYGYFMRRLAERPANVAFVLKGMFR